MEKEVTKVCKVCGRELSIHSFPLAKTMSDGHLNTCKECRNKRAREIKRLRKQNLEITPKIGADAIGTVFKKQPGTKATFKLSDFTDSMLFAELRRRGYEGELKYARVINI